METSRVDGVKAPEHAGTPRADGLVVSKSQRWPYTAVE
jgi:hypothetical protein